MTDHGYFDPEGPGEHDKHLLDRDDGTNDYVDCPKCGASILAFAECCSRCGTWFAQGEAWQAADEAHLPRWLIAAAAGAVLIGFICWMML